MSTLPPEPPRKRPSLSIRDGQQKSTSSPRARLMLQEPLRLPDGSVRVGGPSQNLTELACDMWIAWLRAASAAMALASGSRQASTTGATSMSSIAESVGVVPSTRKKRGGRRPSVVPQIANDLTQDFPVLSDRWEHWMGGLRAANDIAAKRGWRVGDYHGIRSADGSCRMRVRFEVNSAAS